MTKSVILRKNLPSRVRFGAQARPARIRRASAFRNSALELAEQARQREVKWSRLLKRPYSEEETRKDTAEEIKGLITRSRIAKFYDFGNINNALKELVRIHSKGLRFREVQCYSEDYWQPPIGEFAIPGKSRVAFKAKALSTVPQIMKEKENFWRRMSTDQAIVDSIQGEKPDIKGSLKTLRKAFKTGRKEEDADSRAHDVAFLALSINIPYEMEQRSKRGTHAWMYSWDLSPKEPINIEKFAEEYARLSKITNIKEFAEKTKKWYEHLHYMHWDHAADHV